MGKRKHRLILTCILIISASPAYAYIDPGTGSALIQGLIAAVAAVGVTLKLYWHRIVEMFGRRKDGGTESLPSNDASKPGE